MKKEKNLALIYSAVGHFNAQNAAFYFVIVN